MNLLFWLVRTHPHPLGRNDHPLICSWLNTAQVFSCLILDISKDSTSLFFGRNAATGFNICATWVWNKASCGQVTTLKDQFGSVFKIARRLVMYYSTLAPHFVSKEYLYHLESRWCNSHVLVCYRLFTNPPFGSCAIYFHYGVYNHNQRI